MSHLPACMPSTCVVGWLSQWNSVEMYDAAIPDHGNSPHRGSPLAALTRPLDGAASAPSPSSLCACGPDAKHTGSVSKPFYWISNCCRHRRHCRCCYCPLAGISTTTTWASTHAAWWHEQERQGQASSEAVCGRCQQHPSKRPSTYAAWWRGQVWQRQAPSGAL